MKWPTVRLGDVAGSGQYGIGASASTFQAGAPRYIRITDIDDQGNLKPQKVGLNTNEWRDYILEDGDILFARSGATVGKTYLAKAKDGLCAYAGYLIRFKANREIIDPNFLYQYTRTEDYWRWVSLKQNVVAQPNINAKQYADLEIPLPPLPEQKRLAAILDHADSLRRLRRESLARLDEMGQSLFLEMFGDPQTNPKGWGTVCLGEIGELDRGRSKHRPRDASHLYGGKYPFIQTGDVANSEGYIRKFSRTYSEEGLKQSKLWPTGTLCITIAANIAKTGILTFDACFPDSVVGFKATKCDIEYIRMWFVFVQSHLEAMAPESAQKNINLKILRELKVPFPDLALQQKFSERLRGLETIKTRAQTSLTELDALFASLQHRAFAGEL